MFDDNQNQPGQPTPPVGGPMPGGITTPPSEPSAPTPPPSMPGTEPTPPTSEPPAPSMPGTEPTSSGGTEEPAGESTPPPQAPGM